MSFSGFIDLAKTLPWLAYLEKVLKNGLEHLDKDNVRTVSFMLEGNTPR